MTALGAIFLEGGPYTEKEDNYSWVCCCDSIELLSLLLVHLDRGVDAVFGGNQEVFLAPAGVIKAKISQKEGTFYTFYTSYTSFMSYMS